MGFTPRQVDDMTMWEFLACTDAYSEAHGGKKKAGGADMSDDELRALGVDGF